MTARIVSSPVGGPDSDGDGDSQKVLTSSSKPGGIRGPLAKTRLSSGPCNPFGVDVNSSTWHFSVGSVIIINAAVLGFEADYGIVGPFVVLEHLFCWFFIGEMFITIGALGCTYFTSLSYLFDGSLVSFGVFNLYILPQLGSESNSTMSLLRICRLARLLRVLRLLKMFTRLRVVLTAFVESFSSVCWVGSLICILNYTCAVALTVIVGHHAAGFGKDEEKVLEWFGSVGNSLRTLFIILTLNEWDEVAITLGKVYPSVVVFPLCILYILITAYTMVSLITGLITEKLMSVERSEVELRMAEIKQEQAGLLAQIKTQLCRADAEGDGHLVLAEVQYAIREDEDLAMRLEALDVPLEDSFLKVVIDEVTRLHGDPVRGAPIDKVAESMMQINGMARASEMAVLKSQIGSLEEKVAGIRGKVALLAHNSGLQAGARPHRRMLPPRSPLTSKPTTPRGPGGLPGTPCGLSTDVIRRQLESK